MKRSCAIRLTVAIASARPAEPPGGIITRWSQKSSVAALREVVDLGEPLRQSFERRFVMERTLSERRDPGTTTWG